MGKSLAGLGRMVRDDKVYGKGGQGDGGGDFDYMEGVDKDSRMAMVFGGKKCVGVYSPLLTPNPRPVPPASRSIRGPKRTSR